MIGRKEEEDRLAATREIFKPPQIIQESLYCFGQITL